MTPINRLGSTDYARLISAALNRYYGIDPLNTEKIAKLARGLRRLRLEISVEDAHFAYGTASTKRVGSILNGIYTIKRFAVDITDTGARARSRYASKQLRSGISVNDWLAQAPEVYEIIRADADLELSSKGGLFKRRSKSTDSLRSRMIGKTLPALYRAIYPNETFEAEKELPRHRDRWGPGPMFIAFAARFLGFGAVNGEQIHKAKQRARRPKGDKAGKTG